MLVLKHNPTHKKQKLFALLRERAEQKGIAFNDLTLEMEVQAAQTAMENLDMVGHVAHEVYASFVAVCMSHTDHADPDAGHKWLHTWLSSALHEQKCEHAVKNAGRFAGLLIHDTQADLFAFLREEIAEEVDVEKFAKLMGEITYKALEGGRDELPGGEVQDKFDEAVLRLLNKLGAIFEEYATTENSLIAVKNVADSLAQFVPLQALCVYLTNALAATNWGLVPPGLMAQIKDDAFVGEKLNLGFQAIKADDLPDELKRRLRGRGGGNSDDGGVIEDFKEFFDE